MSEIGIITNPHSRLNKQNPGRAQALGFLLGEKGELAKTQNLEELHSVLQRFKERQVKILAINGGDGTITRTLTTMIQVYGDQSFPKIAVLKGGTMNMLALNLGIPGTPESILFSLLNDYAAAQDLDTKTLRTLKIGADYGFVFGNGLVSSFLAEFYKNKSGPTGSLKMIARTILSALFNGKLARTILQDHYLTLRVDEHPPIRTHSIAVLAATVQCLPLGPRFFPRVEDGSEQMQVVLMKLSARTAAFLIPFTAIFSPSRDDYAKISLMGKRVSIESPSFKDYTLDGELHSIQGNELSIELGPAIEFVVPRAHTNLDS